VNRVRLSICATAVVFAMPVLVWANNVAGPSVGASPQSVSYDPGDYALTRGVDFDIGPIGPTDFSATIEGGEDEDGLFEQFQDQVETVLRATAPAHPDSDRSKWMILLIAFAGLTAATLGPRRARRSTMPI
jgi:hypothetical protein